MRQRIVLISALLWLGLTCCSGSRPGVPVEPGDTANLQPSFSLCFSCSGVSTVPEPTMAPCTSPMMARMHSMAFGVRSVISRTGRPPRTSA